jgi:hypothetical protein
MLAWPILVVSFAPLPLCPHSAVARVHAVGLSPARRCLCVPTLRAPSADPQQAKFAKLMISLLIDMVGFSTYLVPLAGEGADLAWAPVSALLINYLYGNALLTGLAFCEELLPGTDFIPTATIGWLLENTDFGQNVNKAAAERDTVPFNAKSRDFRDDGDGVIDVDVMSGENQAGRRR